MIGICGKRLSSVDSSPAPKYVILAGLAGALDPSLRVGDVVLDDGPADLRTAFPGKYGKIHSTTKIVATVQEKAELFDRTGALAVEMEAHIIRPWVAKIGAQFISIRAISDSASQSLDPRLLRIVDDLGRARLLRLALELLKRPISVLPGLFRLAIDSQRAARELGKAVAYIVSQVKG